MIGVDVHPSLRQSFRMTASLLPADDTPGIPGASATPRLHKYYQVKRQLLELTAALDGPLLLYLSASDATAVPRTAERIADSWQDLVQRVGRP